MEQIYFIPVELTKGKLQCDLWRLRKTLNVKLSLGVICVNVDANETYCVEGSKND